MTCYVSSGTLNSTHLRPKTATDVVGVYFCCLSTIVLDCRLVTKVDSGKRWRSILTSITAHICGSTRPTDGLESDWSVSQLSEDFLRLDLWISKEFLAFFAVLLYYLVVLILCIMLLLS